MYWHRPTKHYSQAEVVKMEQEWEDEIVNGTPIPKERLLEMLEAEASGAWGKREYTSEQDMYETLSHGTNSVTPKELEEHMKQAMTNELQVNDIAERSPERLAELEQDTTGSPVREMHITVLPPEAARRSADSNRKKLLDPALTRYDSEQIANELAQDVATYGGIEARIEELKLPESNKTKAQTKASLLEHNALIGVQNDKMVTMHQTDSLNSTVMALSQMRGGKHFGRPIDVEAYKEGLEKQMDELVASGTARERRVAQFAIIAQQSAEELIGRAVYAPTDEATAMVMEKAVKIMEKATKMLESLDGMATPKAGRLVEHVPDKQLPNNAKKSSEPNIGGAS